MKLIPWVFFLLFSACCGSKSTTAKRPEIVKVEQTAGLPVCLQELVKKIEAEERQNPPIKIYSYEYKGALVYFETAPCCDFFSSLYDDSCQLLGHPDGGITGRGDGKFQNFEKEAINKKLVWEDKREEKKY